MLLIFSMCRLIASIRGTSQFYNPLYTPTESVASVSCTESESAYTTPNNNPFAHQFIMSTGNSNSTEGNQRAPESAVPAPRIQRQSAYDPHSTNPPANESFEQAMNRYKAIFEEQQARSIAARSAVHTPTIQRPPAYNPSPINRPTVESIQSILNQCRARFQQRLHAASGSAVPSGSAAPSGTDVPAGYAVPTNRMHRQSPYNHPLINASANESFLQTRNRYRDINAGHQQDLYAVAEFVAPTISREIQPAYRQPLTNNELSLPGVHHSRESNMYIPFGYPDRQALFNQEEYVAPSHNPQGQPVRIWSQFNPPADQPLLPNDHGVEDETDDDDESLFSEFSNVEDIHNEGVEYVDLVSDSSFNGREDVEENGNESEMSNSSTKKDDMYVRGEEYDGWVSISYFNEAKGNATLGDSKMNEAISSLRQNLKDSYMNKINTDVTIKVQNKEFSAHKLILCARSEVFASMFEHDLSEKRTGVIEINDCDPDSFEDFLLFLYTADLKIVTSTNVVGLCKTSDKYGCKELYRECIRFMTSNLSVDTFCDYLPIANLHNESHLLTAVANFFIKNAKTIFPTTKWLALLEDNPSLCNELLIKYSNKAG